MSRLRSTGRTSSCFRTARHAGRFGAVAALGLALTALLTPVANAATTTLSVIDTIPLSGAHLPWAPVYNPTTHRLYSITTTTGVVSVIDTTTNSQVTNISVGTSSGAFPSLAIDQATNRIFAPSQNANTVSVIDGATNTVVNTINLPAGVGPTAVGFNPITNTLFVGGSGTNSVYLYDATTLASEGSLPVDGNLVVGIGVDATTDTEYVANFLNDSVTVIHAGAVVATVPVSDRPTSITVNPVTHKAYVAIRDQDSVAVIDGSTHAITATVTLASGSGPWGGAVDVATNTIYIVNSFGSSLSIIDGATDTLADTFTIPSVGIDGVAVNESAGLIYTTNGFTDNVSVIKLTTSPTITSKAPSGLVKGKAFSHTVTATGTAPITFSVSSGSLPPGLTLNVSTGVISGTPTSTGRFTFTITATNSAGFDSATYTLTVADVTASPTSTDTNAATPTAVDAGYAGPPTRHEGLSLELGLIGCGAVLTAAAAWAFLARRRGAH